MFYFFEKVVFDRPITVAGPPNNLRLALNILKNGSSESSSTNESLYRYAGHDDKCSMRREAYPFEDRSICFSYLIKPGDIASPFLDYHGKTSQVLMDR